MIYDLFKTIKETKNVKQRKVILEQNMSETIRYIFDDTYGRKKYGVTAFMIPDKCGNLNIDNNYIYFHSALDNVHNNGIKGEDAYKFLQDVVSNYDKPSQEILCRIINRNLNIGLSYNSFLNVIGITDAPFKIAKFNEIATVDNIKTDGSYFIMDAVYGVRCICKVNNMGNTFSATFYAENGDEITTLSKLKDSIELLVQPLGCWQFVLDGIIQVDVDLNNEDIQQTIENIVHGSEPIENPKYVLFDIMTKQQFEMISDNELCDSLEYRLCQLDTLIKYVNRDDLSIINYTKIDSSEILEAWTKHPDDCKCSGCIIRKNIKYANNSTKDVLLFKQ